MQTWSGHTCDVSCVALLPDGRVVSGSNDLTLKVWDVKTGTCEQTLSGHVYAVQCVAVLPDGRVVSGSSDNTLKVWDVKTGKCVQTLNGHTHYVTCVALLPDRRVVSGSWDKMLKVWDVKTGTCVQTLSGHKYTVCCVVVLPDGRVVSGSVDDTLKVWNVKTGTCVQTLSGHTDYIKCVAVLPDGRLVSGSMDHTLKVWDVTTGTCMQTLRGHMAWVSCVTLLPDGRMISGSKDKTLKVWEPEEKILALNLTPQDQATLLTAVQKNTSLTALDLSGAPLASIPQGLNLLTTLLEHHPTLYRLNLSYTELTNKELNKLLSVLEVQKRIRNVIVEGNSLSSTALAAIEAYQESFTTSVAKPPSRPSKSKKIPSTSDTLNSLPLSKTTPLKKKKLRKKPVRSVSEETLLLEDALKALQDQQLTTLTLQAIQKKVQDPQASFKASAQPSWRGHKNAVCCVAVLSDGRVVSGSADHTLKVWDVKKGICVQTLSGHGHAVRCIAVLPEGRVVSGSWDNTLKVWDVKTGTCVQTLGGYSVTCVAVLPDGRVVSGLEDNTLKVWDVKTGACVQTLSRHRGNVSCVAVLPEGQVVSGSFDDTLKVWDVKTGKCVQTLSGHKYPISCVAVLPEGGVISGSVDNTLKVWDVKTGTCVQTLRHTDYIGCVAALPDGRVISGSDEKTLEVWDMKTGSVQTLNGHENAVNCVALLPDGRVVSASADQTLKVWEPEEKLLTVNLTPQDRATLLTAVQSNTSLTHLSLSGVPLANTPHGVNWLKAIVEKHPLLERLDLSETGLTDAMFNKFFPILCARKCIEELNVEGNPLLSQSAKDQVEAYQASLKTPLFSSPPLHATLHKMPALSQPVTPIPEPMPQPKPITPPQTIAKTPALPFALQKIAWQSLTLGERIGEGGYGVVYVGTWSGISVAIKQLHITTLSKPLSDEFNHETHIMAQCQFPHIVRLYGVCDEPGHTAMVMEYMPKGSLFQVLHDEKDPLLWNPVRWNIALDIGKGIVYLHGQNIIHRDLKSLNVLLDQQYQAKISDFGLSKVKLQSSSTTTQTQKGVGTTRWMAPELFKRGASPNFASDVYSYGMVLWEIASRQLPYQDAQNDMVAITWIKDGEKENIPQDCPKAYGNIIQQCWEAADKRPTAQAATNLLISAKPQASSTLLKPESKSYVEKSWHFDPATKAKRPSPDKIYELVEATNKDKHKVIQFYQHHPVEGYDIGSVHVIYNADMNYKFSLYLKELQQRDNNLAFKAKWPSGQENIQDPKESSEQIAWRSEIHQQCLTLAKPYQDIDYPAVNLLPMWHGTKRAIVDSIFKTGYANLATTDSGYFGKGIYGAYEAEYSWRVYAKGGALILNWTACFSPYPVMDGDMKKLEGKGNYSNYDAHFIPVVPRNPDNPDETVYYPTKPKEAHQYTELVVFQSAACLPRYLVELQPTLVKPMPSISSSGYSGTFFPSAQQKKEEKPSSAQHTKYHAFNN